MNIHRILKELRAERDRLDQAIAALKAVGSRGGSVAAAKAKPQQRLSAAGRRRISEAMKKRWAERRKKAA